MSDKTKTNVLFLIEKDYNQYVFAYFPEEEHGGGMKSSYSRIGQHSACSPEYADECKQATPEEFEELKEELICSVGYDLNILNEISMEDEAALIVSKMYKDHTNRQIAKAVLSIAKSKQEPDSVNTKLLHHLKFFVDNRGKFHDEISFEQAEQAIREAEGENIFICGVCSEHVSHYTYNEERDVDECNNCKEAEGSKIKERLEYLRQELRAMRISMGELTELQSLSEHIDDGDVELLEAAGVEEGSREQVAKTVYNVNYFSHDGELIDSTQLDEKNEELARKLFVEFGNKLEDLHTIEFDKVV